MPLYTYGYHVAPDYPERATIDGVEYRRIERLPRNLRAGDLLAIGDNTDRTMYHRAYVVITGVDTWPSSGDRYRWYPPQCHIHYRFRECDRGTRMARTWGEGKSVFRGQETKEPVTWAYRAITRG